MDIGIEYSTTEATVSSVLHVHLTHMPYSHSIFSTILVAFIAWFVISRYFNKPKIAIATAISSHVLLNLFTHGKFKLISEEKLFYADMPMTC